MFPGFHPLWKQADKAVMSLLMWRPGNRERVENKWIAIFGT
jgi:hypothetical protein